MKKDKIIDLWSKVVKSRAGYRCEYPNCKKTEYLNSHHFITRKNNATRYDPFNGICLCPYHHTLGEFSAHKDPYFKDVLIENEIRSTEFFKELRLRANKIVKQRDAQTFWKEKLENIQS